MWQYVPVQITFEVAGALQSGPRSYLQAKNAHGKVCIAAWFTVYAPMFPEQIAEDFDEDAWCEVIGQYRGASLAQLNATDPTQKVRVELPHAI